jgi:hypothetical protein
MIGRLLWRTTLVSCLLTGTAAAQQESVSGVLSFLMINRSIATDDFERDEQAALTTRDTISGFLAIELATLPISSSAGGFAYVLNPALGTVMRASDSFGPFFTERSLTVGRRRSSFGVSYQSARFDRVDGRTLRDGTLVSTASSLRGESQPFDVETVALRLSTDTMTVSGNHGVTDRLDVGVAVPFVRLALSGQRVDTYRGRAFVQATGSASASGLGDIVVRAKYNLVRRGGSGVAIGSESRLPSGRTEDLLGSGRLTIQPRVMASIESARVAAHGNVGRVFRGLTGELDYLAAVTVVVAPKITIVGELVGRRLSAVTRLTETTAPHPRLSGVDTIRLTGIPQASHRAVAVAGLKWNVGASWLVSANVVKPVTTAGLDAGWVPSVTVDYSFAR